MPQPVKMQTQPGAFQLGSRTRIVTDAASQITGTQLADRLRTATGNAFKSSVANGRAVQKNTILLTTNGADAMLGPEGYTLNVTPEGAVIRATDQAGMFYGVQTLLQLLPPEVFATNRVRGVKWSLPCIEIADQPRFKWRGLMLDVSRHFFTKGEVKRLLDLMASQKLNTFHWHLVDDQGWRIEIKKYPKLTEIGAWRTNASLVRPHHGTPPVTAHPAWAEPTAFGPDGRYGGFYTQEDIREVVAYAAARHITVIPEIEMPGHSVAALAAYPQFSCTGGPFSTDAGAGVLRGIYCAGKEESFAFLRDVLTEVIPLFPARYIHIGGDEVQKDTWQKCPNCQARIKAEKLKNEEELQSYFLRRMEKFISSHGKMLIGWSEILQGGLPQNAVVMDWIGGGKEAAKAGHDVVMSPQSYCYFDHYQSRDLALEPRGIGGFLPLEKVYAFEPVPAGLDAQHAMHILGAQANLWTEYIASQSHLEYMMFPRVFALAEAVWSPKEARNWSGFTNRLGAHERRLALLEVNHRHNVSAPIGEWMPSQIRPEIATLDWDVSLRVTGAGQYRMTLEYTTGNHGISIASLALLEDGREVACDAHEGFAGAEPRSPVYVLELPAFKPGARYTLRAAVKGEGGTDSRGIISCVLKPQNSVP